MDASAIVIVALGGPRLDLLDALWMIGLVLPISIRWFVIHPHLIQKLHLDSLVIAFRERVVVVSMGGGLPLLRLFHRYKFYLN